MCLPTRCSWIILRESAAAKAGKGALDLDEVIARVRDRRPQDGEERTRGRPGDCLLVSGHRRGSISLGSIPEMTTNLIYVNSKFLSRIEAHHRRIRILVKGKSLSEGSGASGGECVK